VLVLVATAVLVGGMSPGKKMSLPHDAMATAMETNTQRDTISAVNSEVFFSLRGIGGSFEDRIGQTPNTRFGESTAKDPTA